jgi:hypothetical protein
MRVPGRFLVWTRALSGSENLHKKKEEKIYVKKKGDDAK